MYPASWWKLYAVVCIQTNIRLQLQLPASKVMLKLRYASRSWWIQQLWLWYTCNWRQFGRARLFLWTIIKGGRDLCVKSGLDTPGEEVSWLKCWKVHDWCTMCMACDVMAYDPTRVCAYARALMNACVQSKDVLSSMCVSHPIQKVTGGCVSSKEHLDILSKGRAIPWRSLCLHIWIGVSPSPLKDEAWRAEGNV